MSHLLPSLPPSHTKSGCREPRPQLPNRMSACQRPELCPEQGKGQQRKATRGKAASQKHTHTQWALIQHSTVALTAREHPRRPPSWNQLEHCQLQFWKGASPWLTPPMSAPPTIPTLLDLLPPCLLHLPPPPAFPSQEPRTREGGRSGHTTCIQKPRADGQVPPEAM